MPKMQNFKPGGLNQYTGPENEFRLIEQHSSTCSHCQHITDFPSMREMMSYVDICRGCMKLICQGCVGKPCVPYEKMAELAETEHKIKSRIHMQGWGCY
jgi:hypothetical protein